MDRSIKKTISVNELKYIFQKNEVKKEDRARLIPELFDNLNAAKTYLLKKNIRTRKELEENICKVIDNNDNRDCVLAIVKAFYVDDDLNVPVELRNKLLSNEKLAFFVGAGVSKLLKIPLWDELAGLAIAYLRDNNHINYAEYDQLRYGKYTAKQIMSIFYKIVKDEKRNEFYKTHLNGEVNKNGNPYELLFEIERVLA